jgi:predicted ATP-grasp superfamily ATP-dependent carboligase
VGVVRVQRYLSSVVGNRRWTVMRQCDETVGMSPQPWVTCRTGGHRQRTAEIARIPDGTEGTWPSAAGRALE